jgi:hypothetical protein
MKILIRGIILILIAALVGLLAYAFWRYVLPYWAPILFYLYLILGGLQGILSIIVVSRSLLRPADISQAITQSIYSVTADLITKTRIIIQMITAIPVDIMCWPLNIIYGIFTRGENPSSSFRELSARANMISIDLRSSIYAFSMVSLLFILSHIGINGHGYGSYIVILFGISIFFRHIGYAITPGGLPRKIRRISNNPYAHFALISLMDFSVIVSSTALFSNIPSLYSVSLKNIFEASKSFFALSDIQTLIENHELSKNQLIIAIFAVVFNISVLSTIARYKEFRRDDEDLIWIATLKMITRNFSEAVRTLVKIKHPTQVSESLSIGAYLGVNNIETALEIAEKIAKSTEKNPNIDTIFVAISNVVMQYQIPKFVLEKVVKIGVQRYVSDYLLMSVIMATFGDTEAIALRSTFVGVEANYPLSLSLVDVAEEKFDAARQRLREATPGSEVEEALRLVNLLMLMIGTKETTHEEDEVLFSEWLENDLQKIKSIIPSLSDLMHLSALLGSFTVFLESIERFEHLGHNEEIRFLYNSLTDQIEKNHKSSHLIKFMSKFAHMSSR